MKKHSLFTSALALLMTLCLLFGCSVLPASAASVPTGDVDNSGQLDVGDIMKIKNLIMAGNWTEAELSIGDMDGNGAMDVADIMILKNMIMTGAPIVTPPGEPDDPVDPPDDPGKPDDPVDPPDDPGKPDDPVDPPVLSDTVDITVMSRSSVVASGEDALAYSGLQPGDSIEFKSDHQYLWVKINDNLGETLIYTESGVFTYQVPKATDNYPANAFSGNNSITARVATAEEIAERRNLAVNVYDFKFADEVTVYNAGTADLINESAAVEAGQVQAYPHAYANRVTENKTIFEARNAIDGVIETAYNHSNYPYQSWGCGKYDDVEFVVYFGREVTLDELAFVLRADFGGTPEHDTYWESITAEFSDGSTQTFTTQKGGQKQSFKLDKEVTTTYVRLKDLVRHEDANSAMWAALIELEAYGTDTATENTAALKKTVTPDFGGKEIVETIDDYSAAEIAETIEQVYNYYATNYGVNDDGWEAGVYYVGVSDAYMTTGNLDYYLACRAAAETYGYMVNAGTPTINGDDYCISQMYLTLNDLAPADYKIASVIENADYNVARGELDYHWCDALFMSGLVFTELTNLTGDAKYADTNYKTYLKWRNGTDGATALYDETYHLWYRDADQKRRTTTSGQPVFWSRGDAWVFAHLARQLAYITDTTSEEYQTYLQDFKDMAAALKSYQRADGTWNPCVNDGDFYGGMETTGTAGYLYGFAIGVELGILDREEYLPVALKAYDALTGICMIQPGKIGYMQAVAGSPDNYVSEENSKNNMLNYGTGLFLMGASALMRMCEDYEVPALEVPLDTQDRSFARYSVEPGFYKGQIIASASASQEGNEVAGLFDLDVTGTPGKRWSVEGYPQWAMADLGKEIALNKVCLYALDARDYLYKVDVSDNGYRWVTVVDRTQGNTSSYSYMDTFEPINARYVRLTITGAQTYNGPWISCSELLMYEYTGTEPVRNVADIYEDPYEGVTFVPGTVTASYTGDQPAIGYFTSDAIVASASAYQIKSDTEKNPPEYLVDGKWASNDEFGVRWSVEGYPQWAMLDLGETISLEKLTMFVYQGRQYYYQLEVSTDGQSWQTITILDTPYQTGENHTYTLSEAVDARYVRLTVNGANPASYNGAWISIKEIFLYAAAE